LVATSLAVWSSSFGGDSGLGAEPGIAPFGSWFYFPPETRVTSKPPPVFVKAIDLDLYRLQVVMPSAANARRLLDDQLLNAGFAQIELGCSPATESCVRSDRGFVIARYMKPGIEIRLDIMQEPAGSSVLISAEIES
jgi:hypothetical protein